MEVKGSGGLCKDTTELLTRLCIRCLLCYICWRKCEVFPGGFADMSDAHPDFGRFKVLESAKSQGDGFLVPKNTGTGRSLPNIGNMLSAICYSIARATV